MYSKIEKDNLETSQELDRISQLIDPIKMYQEKQEIAKAHYMSIKDKWSQLTSANGSVLDPGSTRAHQSIFDRSRPRNLKHSRFNDRKTNGKHLFSEMQDRTLSLINPGKDGCIEVSLCLPSSTLDSGRGKRSSSMP